MLFLFDEVLVLLLFFCLNCILVYFFVRSFENCSLNYFANASSRRIIFLFIVSL